MSRQASASTEHPPARQGASGVVSPRVLLVWLLLGVGALIAIIASLMLGSSSYSPVEVMRALAGGGGSARDVVIELRLPRTLAAFATGGLLAVAGALMQVLLRNPLADPYVLGLSGGAATGALGAMLIGFGALLVNAAAFGGAVLAMSIVFVLARREFLYREQTAGLDAAPRLLLIGVILAAGWGALITAVLSLAPAAQLRGMIFWLVGDLNGVDTYVVPLLALAAVLAAVYPHARSLNVLARGDVTASALGVPVAATRRLIYVCASLATAIAVTTAGAIGFLGLVVPHALRLLMGNDQRALLPACALAGGALLVCADTLARTALAPSQLPVGVLTALIGVPSFLALLLHRKARV
jgi:iron complex transport system permease protein